MEANITHKAYRALNPIVDAWATDRIQRDAQVRLILVTLAQHGMLVDAVLAGENEIVWQLPKE